MKRFSLVLAILLFCTAVATATDLSMGFKAGLVLANQDFDYRTDMNVDFENRLGFQGGVFAEAAVTPSLSLQLGLQYVSGGLKNEVMETTEAYPEGTGRILTFKPRIDYITVPVLIKAGFPTGVMKPYVIAGPRMNIQVGIDKSDMALVYNYLKKVSFGLIVGAGTEVRISPKAALMFEVTYNPDFTNIFKADEASADLPEPAIALETIKNRVIGFAAGIRF